MSARSVLLRILLCLVLLVNGVGSAAAAVETAWASTAATSSASDAHAPCHAHGMHRRDTHVDGLDHRAADSVSPDCCKPHGGGCACTLAAHVVTAQSVPMPGLARDERPAILVRGHVPPSLPDPIRPPIG